MSEADSRTQVEGAILSAGIPRDARLLLAVSGGADSVALLHAVAGLAGQDGRRWDVVVGHVNHGLRGTESDEDERFVCRLAKGVGAEVEVARSDVAPLAAERGLSIETAAREERYRLLWAMLDRAGAHTILTGHTEDDQAETLLLHLLRGAGPSGLGAMRKSPGFLVRPLLAVSKETILDYIQHHGLPYRLDSSNLDLRHMRNRVRREVIPELRRLNPSTTRALARTAGIAQDDADYIAREAETALQTLHVGVTGRDVWTDLRAWRTLHPALRRATLRSLVSRLLGSSRDITFAHISAMDAVLSAGEGEARAHHGLPHGLTLCNDGSRFCLTLTAPTRAPSLAPVQLRIPGSLSLSVGVIRARPLAVSDTDELSRLRTVCGPFHALCDAAKLGATLIVRSRRPGDRVRPLGLGGTRKVQDILVDDKVPRAQRDAVLVVENHDHIVWIPGHALDERSALGPHTGEVVHLSCAPVQGPQSARIFRHSQS
jgi:tRNA(Ile)-lysidine synthase